MNGKRRITESPEGAPGCIGITEKYIYLLLAEFSVRTVNYGPSFFPSIYGPSAKRAGHKSMEKNEDP